MHPDDHSQGPSFLRKGINFGIAAVKHHVFAGGRQTTPMEARRRLSICEACPANQLSAERQCLLCGCPVDEKVTWASERCPHDPPFWDVEKSTFQKPVPATGQPKTRCCD